MNAEQRQRVSDAVEREHPYPDDDGAHPFALDEDGVPVALTPEQEDWAALFSPPLRPTHEVVAIVSAPASLAERLAAVERVRVLVRELTRHANHWGRNDHTSNARALVDSHAAAYAAIDALAGITPADRARAEGR